uniref:Uncharacterized protein n=1 Tax=Brassica campestris TaxID=3711 RepID=M4ELY6_BRACM
MSTISKTSSPKKRIERGCHGAEDHDTGSAHRDTVSVKLWAVVSITCMDERERVRYYGSDKTDERGQFDLIVDKVLYGGKNLKPNLCNVRLVSPADQSCGIPTDFGNGQTGEKLVQPFMVFKNLVKFVVGPFYYTTPMCDTPKYENNY